MLASTTINRQLIAWRQPGFDYRWTRRNAVTWALTSLPSALLAVLMALLVPRLESLTGLLNSLAGATLQITAVPFCLWLSRRTAVRSLAETPRWLLLSIAVYGLFFTAAVFASALQSIWTTQYMPAANETFWCDLAG